jgi:hypothetical protein
MTQRSFQGLFLVNLDRLKQGAPIVVGGFDDRFNLVGGLTFKQRIRVLRGVEAALDKGDVAQARQDTYATWAALEILHRVMDSKGLRWSNPTGSPRLKRGSSVADLLPPAAWLPGQSAQSLGRTVVSIRRRLEHAVFDEGVPIPNQFLQAAAARALAGDERAHFTHKSVADVLRFYGLGVPVALPRQRGHRVAYWRLRQLLELENGQAALDLRQLPWRHGAYRVSDAYS